MSTPAHAVSAPKAPRRKETVQRATAALQAAVAARGKGAHREGIDHATRALQLAGHAGQATLRGMALGELALNEFRVGQCESAAAHGREALPLLRRKADAAARAQVLCTLVIAHNEMGLYSESLGFATAAIDSARQANDRSLLSWALNRAGGTYQELEDSDRGEPLVLQALAIAREIGGDEEMFSALNNLCANLLRVARLQAGDERERSARRSLVYGMEGLALAQASGNTHREAVVLTNIADACVLLGELERAEPYIEREEQLGQERGYRSLLVSARLNRAGLLRRRGDLAGALQRFEAVLATSQTADDHDVLLRIHQELYDVHKAMDNAPGALRHLEAILPLERERLQLRAERQSRLYLNRIEIENLQAAAERARGEADAQREKAAQLESENQRLADREQELKRHAMEDQLTGLANRRRFDAEFPRLLAGIAQGRRLCVAGVDLDHFKQVNDVYGHGIGDDVLRTIGQLLRANMRETDLVSRLGGEEFVAVLTDAPLQQGAALCERLRRAVEAFDWSTIAAGLHVTVSIGVCAAAAGVPQAELLEQADRLLYAAKRNGRNRVETG